ncbi:MAG: 30S ribosomal protein S6 [Myxococcota bacterium]|nr:30S ribosomal protein S6 [Myxococcota bacterium]
MNVTKTAAPARSESRVRAKEYETIYVLRSDVDGDTAERVQARVADAVVREHGTIVKVEAWGRRRLAYPVAKQRKGVYVYLKFVGGAGLVAEVERNLKLQDSVVKFMTVLTSEDVDPTALQIDPEETKLGKLDLPPEDEKEESREKQLGLIDMAPDMSRHARPAEEGEESEAEEGDDAAARQRSARAAATPAAAVPPDAPATGGVGGAGGSGGEEA